MPPKSFTWSDVGDAVQKYIADVFSTKTQAGLVGVWMVAAIILRGLTLAKTAQDVRDLMAPAWPLVGLLMATWGVIKITEIRKNGGTPPTPPG